MGDYQKAIKHFQAALKHLDPAKDAALWNLASGLIELAGAADGWAALSQDSSISESLARIERALHQLQKAR